MTDLQTNFVRLIITAPNQSFMPFWHKAEGVFLRFLPGWKNYDAYATSLATGLPFHLPLSFQPDEAEALAGALRALNCTVRILPE